MNPVQIKRGDRVDFGNYEYLITLVFFNKGNNRYEAVARPIFENGHLGQYENIGAAWDYTPLPPRSDKEYEEENQSSNSV